MKKIVNFKHFRRRCMILVTIIAGTLLSLGTDVVLAQVDNEPLSPENTEQHYKDKDEQEPITGYPARKRYVGGPTDVEWDLDNSFPKSGSLLELILECDENKNK